MDFPALRRLPARTLPRTLLVSLSLVLTQNLAPMAVAQTAAFTQSLAATASSDEAIAEWYRTTAYDTLWTGADDVARRSAFLTAIATAKDHGLPVARYDAAKLTRALQLSLIHI